MFKRVMSVTLIMFFLLTTFVQASSNNVAIEGIEKNIETEIKDARTYVTLESIASLSLETSVNGNEINLKNEDVNFKFVIDSNQIKVNDLDLNFNLKPYKKNNKIYLPLRFILETLNYNIKWDSKNNKVIIKKQEKITYPIKVKNGNNEYIIKKEPEKIVSLAPGVTEKLYALGVLDKVKGRTQYCNYPKEVKNITNIGSLYEPNLETIIDINPDIVIGETHFKEKHLNKLNSAGINTVAKSTATDIEGVYEYMIELGAIVNRNYEARALVSSLKSKATRAEYILKDIKENEKPSVYYVVGTGQSGEYTAGGNTFISSLINLAGGKNIAKNIDGWSYSIEKLVDNDPDIIFGAKYNIDTMVSGENYQSLSAIRKNKYYTFNRNIIERAAPRAINQGLKELIKIFHNDKVDKLNF